MIEMLCIDPINGSNEGLPSDALCIAKFLLVMACIPPRPDSDGSSDQYSIDSFKVSAEKIEIRNHGMVHVLKVKEHV